MENITNFIEKEAGNIASDAVAVLALESVKKGRLIMPNQAMLKEMLLFIGSKFLNDIIMPLVPSVTAKELQNAIVEILTTALSYFVLKRYVLKQKVNMVAALLDVLAFDALSDRTRQLVNKMI